MSGMKTADFNFTNASAAIDEYLRELNRPDKIPTQISNRVWIEFLLERHGILADVRKLSFGQSHAAWYACLLKTGRVRQVSRAESSVFRRPGSRTTESTIRRLTKGDLRSSVTGAVLSDLLAPHPAIELWALMFREAEAEDRIENPSYWVERGVFVERCRREGIEVPEPLPDLCAWEERIGLTQFVRRTLDDYYRRKKLTRDPMTAGAHRLERHMVKAGLWAEPAVG